MRRPASLCKGHLVRKVGALAAAVAVIAAGAAVAQTAAPTPQAPGAQPASPQTAGATAPAGQAAAPAATAPAEAAPPPVIALPPEEPAPLAPEAPSPEPVAEAPEEPEVPAKRARYDVAILQALDKITAGTVRFEAAVGKPVRYKSLVFTVKACERSTDEEPAADAIAYLTIESQPKAAPGKPTPVARQAFRGWMYASSPGLNPLEHPVYDAWLITCRAASPS